jgi:hypothetical protein
MVEPHARLAVLIKAYSVDLLSIAITQRNELKQVAELFFP